MSALAAVDAPATPASQQLPLDLLRAPLTGSTLERVGDALVSIENRNARFRIAPGEIPLFAEELCSQEARIQQAHYDRIADAYVANLGYPHTQEYMAYLDEMLERVVDRATIGTAAELCCGRGEAFHLFGRDIARGVGVDVSVSMLGAARAANPDGHLAFVQGDATVLPLASGTFDTVFMLGGIHHVNDRQSLFSEVARILRPGGRFYFREPVSDFALWRWIRAAIYRISPTLDHLTERPLLHADTVPVLESAGMTTRDWSTHGFLGFCLFMNSDVLVVNRLFRFVPGIRRIARWSTVLDAWILSMPRMKNSGLQVIGVAEKRAN
jgi:ubiquinone/menaquinone biosynthesis C-methylase UbiE